MQPTPIVVRSDADRAKLKCVSRHHHLMGEFALILAAKGHAVDYQTLERLADVAIGDV
jgi:hypothetical protein